MRGVLVYSVNPRFCLYLLSWPKSCDLRVKKLGQRGEPRSIRKSVLKAGFLLPNINIDKKGGGRRRGRMIIRLLPGRAIKKGHCTVALRSQLGSSARTRQLSRTKPSFQHRKDGEACIPPCLYTDLRVLTPRRPSLCATHFRREEMLQLVVRSYHNYVSAPKKRMGRKASVSGMMRFKPTSKIASMKFAMEGKTPGEPT